MSDALPVLLCSVPYCHHDRATVARAVIMIVPQSPVVMFFMYKSSAPMTVHVHADPSEHIENNPGPEISNQQPPTDNVLQLFFRILLWLEVVSRRLLLIPFELLDLRHRQFITHQNPNIHLPEASLGP